MKQPIVRQIITPSALQLILCAVLASAILIINLRQWIFANLTRSASLEPGAFASVFNDYSASATAFAHSTIGKILFALLLLAGLAIFGYGMRSASKTGGKSELLFPKHRLMAKLFMRIITVLLLVTLIFATVRYTQPLWLSMANQAVLIPFGPITVVAAIIALVGSTINYYALLVFSKLTFVV